jgi:putative transcriptional regulator
LYTCYVPRERRNEDEDRVHNRLAVLRAERGMSRQDLAAALGVHYQTVGYLERGDYNPSLALALRAARTFGLPVEALFSLEPFEALSAQVYGARDRKDEERR